MDNMRAIRALIDTLRIPSLEPRVRSASHVHNNVFMLTDTRCEGSRAGHVLRSPEHQDAGVVPNIHQREAINKYVSLFLLFLYYVDLTDYLTVYRKSRNSHEHAKAPEPAQQTSEPLKLTDQYIALLVLVFTQAGLLDVRISALYLYYLSGNVWAISAG